MKGKFVKKIVMLILVCILMLLDVFIISKQIVQAEGEDISKQEETKITIEQGIEKYFEVEENQILLQQEISVILNKEDKIKTSENLIVNVPIIGEYAPNSAIVLLNGIKLPDNTYIYDLQNKKLEININAENQLESFDNKQNIYTIIYTYFEMPIQEKIMTKLDTNVKINIDSEGEVTATNEQEIETEIKGSNISLTGAMTKEVYKGYLYQGTQFCTSYAEINRIEISNTSNLENIIIRNASERFIEEDKMINSTTNQEEIIETENEVNQSLYYTLTRVNKNEMIRILGNEGKITIYNLDDEMLAEFNKDTETDEQGNIIFTYNGETTTGIKIVTTKPLQEGRIDFYHEKAIKANIGYTREDIERFDYVRETIQANDEMMVMNMHLTEPSTQFDVNVSKIEYSTMNINKDVDISITLKNNQNNMCLYENSEIEIVFPEAVQNLEIQDQVNLLYDSELSIKNTYVDGNVIHITLDGAQTNYKEIATQINLKVNIEFDKTLTNRTSEIVTKIRNKSEEVENRKEVSITSPREFITVNNIQELGVESYGEEKQVTTEITKKSDEKTMQVKSEVINNTGNISSIKILGEFPTNDSENNLGAIVNTPIQVDGVNATIYYSTNEEATEDIGDDNNGWVNDINTISDVKKYLIIIDEIYPDNSARFTYSAYIPANLEYNQKATEGYTVYYTDSESNVNNKADATNVLMTTGDGPIVEANLIAKINGEEINTGDTLKAGEKIRYEVNLKNTGTMEANNVAVDLTVSQSNNAENNEVASLEVETIAPNETRIVTYEKEIPADLNEDITITTNTTVTYEEEQKNTNEVVLNVEPSAIVGNVRWDTMENRYDENGNIIGEAVFTQGNTISYVATVTNNTNEIQSDLVLHWELPEYCELVAQQKVIGNDNSNKEDLEVTKDLVLEDLQPGESIEIYILVYLGEFDTKTEKVYAIASVEQNGDIYRLGKTEERVVYNAPKFIDVKLTANDEDDYVKTDNEINYTLTITNNNPVSINALIRDEIPTQLTILEVDTDNGEVERTGNYIVVSNIGLQPDETTTITIKTIVNYVEIAEDEIIENQFTLLTGSNIELTSNTVRHMIDRQSENPEEPNNPEDPDNPDNPSNPEEPSNPENPNQPSTETYKISGTVWLDNSLEGRRDDNESGVSGINIYLMNAQTNQITDVSTMTNAEGFYTLSNIPNGEYIVVFDYSSTQYGLTKYQASGIENNRNSKALEKQINIFGVEKTCGVTDIITINGGSIGNISMGLTKLEDFDLKIDKYISRVTVKTQNGTTVYSYNDVQLAKTEINARKINNAEITVEYTIKVTNVGQVDGYARSIVDHIPDGFTFDPTKNKDWYSSGNDIYSVILANEKIAVGDSKVLTLTLTKDLSEDATGTFTNHVNIDESYNEFGISDTNARSGNDSSSAELIISIGTGTVVLYTMLTLSIIGIMGIGIYAIKVKVLGVKNEERG